MPLPVYKDSKKGTWYCKFRYNDWQGNRRETTRRGFATKREAKEYEAEFIRKAQGTADMTLKSLYEIYLEDKRQKMKLSSFVGMKNSLDVYVMPILGDTPLSDLTPNSIRQWQNHLSQVDKKQGGKLRPATLLSINRKLSALLNFAVKYYGLNRNPLAIAGTQGHGEKRLDFWSKDEFDKFLAEVKHPLFHCLFLLLFYTGMRIGEALALTKEDIEGNAISITKARSRQGQVTPPKTPSSVRTVTLPSIAFDCLKNVCQRIETDEIFPFTYTAAHYHYKIAIEKAGIRYLPIHCLRHAHASLLIDMGVPIPAVSQRLGHTSPQVTMEVYAHATQDSDKLIADKLNTL